MGDNQEKRYLCKECELSFSNGRVLGGHMRGHMAKSSRRKDKILDERKNEVEPSSDVYDAEQQGGYELRENPKKSWKSSLVETRPNPRGDFECQVCGKGFESIKALFGHMRSHPRKEKKRLKSLGDKFQLSDQMRTSSSLCPVRGKRSIRIRCTSIAETGEDVKEVAFSLMLLSRGIRNWEGSETLEEFEEKDRFDQADIKFSENVGLEFEVDLTSNRGIGKDEFETTDYDPRKKFKIDSQGSESSSSTISLEKHRKGEMVEEDTSKHACPICFKEFVSGRALGGHKRAHTVKASAIYGAANKAKVVEKEPSSEMSSLVTV